jgi:hypothetical protein
MKDSKTILRHALPEAKIVGFSAMRGDFDIADELIATKKFDVVLSKLDGLEKLVDAITALLRPC